MSRCTCASCKIGLSCYHTDKPVVGASGGETTHFLWGDILTSEHPEAREAAREMRPFELGGVQFTPTRVMRQRRSRM